MIQAKPIVLIALGAALALLADDAPRRDSNFRVHEWGTFTTLAGSNGAQIGGLVYDEDALPRFVHERRLQPQGFDGVRVKMETPVIYVYSDAEREVSIKVAFPQGVLTQWFPHVRGLAPRVDAKETAVRGGELDWGALTVLAPGAGLDRVPAVAEEDSWGFARAPRANVLRNCSSGEHERFLFYRGLGSFDLPVRALAPSDESVSFENRGAEPIAPVMALRVRGGKVGFELAAAVAPGRSIAVPAAPREMPLGEAMDEVAAQLVRAGLHPDEALAMVRTWRRSYFQTDGFRILYVVPRPQVDAILPLAIDPKPKEIVRVLVGRLDVLLPSDEAKANETVRRARSLDQARAELGRFAEPIVAHLRDTSGDAEVRARAAALLAR